MGVWIETFADIVSLWETKVTPFVGVWIETFLGSQQTPSNQVTPFVGVWIETTQRHGIC